MNGTCDQCLAEDVIVEPCDLMEGDWCSCTVLLCEPCGNSDDQIISLSAQARAWQRESERWEDA